MKYLIYNNAGRAEHYIKEFENEDDVYHWIINTLDCSKNWSDRSLKELLKFHKVICDAKDYDYEFHYEDDIANNDGAYLEILKQMDDPINQRIWLKTFDKKPLVLDINENYWLDNGDVVSEHLVGDTVETVKSDGWWLFSGELGKMKPVQKLSEAEAVKIVLERGRK